MSFQTNGPGFTLKVTSGRNAFVSFFTPLFLVKFWHMKIKSWHQNPLFKYRTVHFDPGINPCRAGLLQAGATTEVSLLLARGALALLPPGLPAELQSSGAMTNFSPQLSTSLLACAGRWTQSSYLSSGSSRNRSQRLAGQTCLPWASWPRSNSNNLPFLRCLASLQLSYHFIQNFFFIKRKRVWGNKTQRIIRNLFQTPRHD